MSPQTTWTRCFNSASRSGVHTPARRRAIRIRSIPAAGSVARVNAWKRAARLVEQTDAVEKGRRNRSAPSKGPV